MTDIAWRVAGAPTQRRGALADAAFRAVTLGFADGASVVLNPDDPRLERFRAAAEAVLETTQV